MTAAFKVEGEKKSYACAMEWKAERNNKAYKSYQEGPKFNE